MAKIINGSNTPMSEMVVYSQNGSLYISLSDGTKSFTYTVTEKVSGATYGFALNSSGYYESQNKAKASSYALCRVNLTVNQTTDIVFSVINFGESSFDYGYFSNLDTALTLDNADKADGATGIKESFKSQQSATPVTLTYSGVTAGTHFIDIKYRKDGSVDKDNDTLQWKIVE